MRVLKFLSFAVAFATAAVAIAQPPGGGRGGRGGFGGPGAGGPASLVMSKTVQSDLKITPAEADKLKTWSREYGAKVRETMMEKMRDIPREEMREKVPEIMAEISADAYKELGDVLSADQVKRLKQIDLQVQGLRAFNSPKVAADLKITDDQKAKLQDVIQDMGRDMRDLGEEFDVRFPGARPTEPEKAREYDKKLAKINQDAKDAALAVMTAEQKEKYKELTGPEIDVAKVMADSTPAIPGGGRKKKRVDD